MNILRLSVVICSFISLLLVVLALATDYWASDYTGHYGLWKLCITDEGCAYLGMSVKGELHAIRAFILIGMTLGAFCFFGVCATYFYPHIGSFPLTKVVAITNLCAAFCVMIAMAIFKGTYGGYGYFGWSFYLGWTSMVMFIITGVRTYRLQVSSEWESI
ncbi:lens fiber membrane intrinsic protein-like [Hemicordylus capensis]|uniref:lens fiber membrane intrinsic protein-like n=1 Tax=Hemicordylus capensis TaxID=884348 RepID=UPI002304863A|nr:lens fiber membrane intrinsic protein-like [Hemicordylus capensis]XP_053123838.1 lens fiber membrane intrinsic protein-like [Hemicordylus capensis]